MNTVGTLKRTIAALEKAGIPYMLTGSFASSYHGTPRSTQDIDIVIAPDDASLQFLLESFPESEYYVSESAAKDAMARRTQFNIIDPESGWKVDFIIKKMRPFNQSEFDRRIQVEIGGIPMHIATPEDMILSKLEWAAEAESERQIRDVAGIINGKRDQLDWAYLRKWVEELAVVAEWGKAKAIAESLAGKPLPGG